MKMRRVTPVVAMVVAGLLIGPGVVTAGAAGGPLAPASPNTYKELSAKWWQWAASTPGTADGPFGNGNVDCGVNQPKGNTWLLEASAPAADRSCAIPAGTRLFFPVVNLECSSLEADPFFGGSVAERQACVQKEAFTLVPLLAELDGTALVSDFTAGTVISPNFPINAVAGNVFGIPEGRGFSVSKGTWLLLAPLSSGCHELHFAGSVPAFQVTFEATYHLNCPPT